MTRKVLVSASMVSGTSLALVTFVDANHDIRQEAELRFAQSAVDLACDSIFSMDKNGKFTYVNNAACISSGYSREELLSMSVPDLDPNFSGETWAAHWNLKRQQGSTVLESVHRTKNGCVYPVEISSNYLSFNGREYACAIVRDIRARKAAGNALRESEERFHQLFEQNEEALIIFQSGSSRILDANPATLNLYGYDKRSLTEHGPSLVFPAPDLAEFEKALSGLTEQGGFTIENAETRTRDGRKVRINIRGKAIKLSDTDVVYCTFRDITEKTRLEEEASLLHSKLIHANKMASLGVLVSSVAHEVNNPNNFIMFNASLLTDAWRDALYILNQYSEENGDFSLGGVPYSEMESAVSRLLLGVTEGARRIKGIVDNLKDFARQDNGDLEGEVDMNRVVSGAAALLAGQIKQHTTSFSLDLAAHLPHVRGSFQQLEQVIINLVMNALQALPEKHCAITVSTLPDPGSGHIRVEVKDQGIGMSRETMGKIMEPFFTTKLDTGGTGLGLSISHSIIKDHRGSLEFQSEPMSGTTATIKLPIPEPHS